MSDNSKKFWDEVSIYRLDAPPPSDGVKIVDIYQKIENDLLDLSPDFQRKLVWKQQHKFNFIKTILMNFPFPEVYIASKDIDVDEMTAVEIVVDGKQRLTTICDYINGDDVFVKSNKVVPLFSELDNSKKKSFLNYKVTVRDLKDVNSDYVDEIFRRINSTEYPLNKIELLNSIYGDSEFVCFSKQLVDRFEDLNLENIEYRVDKDFCEILQNSIYHEWAIFPERDRERMFVLMFFMNVVICIMEGKYHSRNGASNDFVVDYNDNFPQAFEIQEKLKKSYNLILLLKLSDGSFFFSKSMLFTLLVEFSNVDIAKISLDKLKKAFEELEMMHLEYMKNDFENFSSEDKLFFEFTRNSVNEKRARESRGAKIENILKGCLK